MFFTAPKSQYVYVIAQYEKSLVTIDSPNCKVNDAVIGNPCKRESDYLVMTIDDVTKYDQLLVYETEGMCIANFVPKCMFKPVEPGNVVPEVSFPFARFANGANSIEIKFSINGSESNVKSALRVRYTTLCEWTGMKANSSYDPKYCSDLTKNVADDRLDFTLVYKLEEEIGEQEPVLISNFVFSTEKSGIGVSVYWKDKGESPDIAECRKNGNLFTTSSGCSIGFSFTSLLGIAIWSFK
nr:diagnostic antigen gp50 [Hymenolepis microstoma]